jgi:hypothetical protein
MILYFRLPRAGNGVLPFFLDFYLTVFDEKM